MTNPSSGINFDALREAIKTKMREKNLSFRAAADEAGMMYNTLNQITNRGRIPDAENYVALCDWLGVSVNHFVPDRGIEQNLEGLTLIDALLYRDPHLSLSDARKLSELLHTNYRLLTSGDNR